MHKHPQILKALELLKREGTGGNSNYCVVGETSFEHYHRQACHLGLGGEAASKVDRRIAVVNYLNDPTHGSEGVKIYLQWLLNESPFAFTFVSKDVDQVLKDKYIIHDAHTPANLMAAGCVTVRHLWENEHIIANFVALVKRGVNKNLAFLLAHIGFASGKSWDLNHYRTQHTCVTPCRMDSGAVLNFMRGNVVSEKHLYSDGVGYLGITAAWGAESRHSNLRDDVIQWFESYDRGGTTEYVNYNPFVQWDHYKPKSDSKYHFPTGGAYDHLAELARAISTDVDREESELELRRESDEEAKRLHSGVGTTVHGHVPEARLGRIQIPGGGKFNSVLRRLGRITAPVWRGPASANTFRCNQGRGRGRGIQAVPGFR